jgi:putative transposase
MKRIQRPENTAIYHCLSRCVHGERWLDEHGKAVFCQILTRLSAFCGIRVLTYCVMSNHFHLLLEVPKKEDCLKIPDHELLRRFSMLYGEDGTDYMPISTTKLESIFKQNDALAHRWRKCLQERMHDLPLFMKLLKHRFTKWYNTTHKTYGTFWAERYASLLVEPDGEILRKIASYIDLNPVRAGLVEDPACYAWSGYGSSRMGNQHQRALIERLASYGGKMDELAFAAYEQELYWRGAFAVDAPGKRGVIPQKIANDYTHNTKSKTGSAGFGANMAKILWSGCVYGSQSFVETNAVWVRKLLGRKKTSKSITQADEQTWYVGGKSQGSP